MSEARIGRISNENSTAGPIISGITTFSGQNYFVPPKGTTAERPSNCPVGSIRFNTDSAKLEYFDGLQWLEMEAFNVELGVSGALGNRGVFSGGQTPTRVSTIDYLTISTLGNAISFGSLSATTGNNASCSSSTRGISAGGDTAPTIVNTIDFITISSTGNASSFGTLTQARRGISGCASATRGIFAGGYSGPTYYNTLDYITIASTGNAVDFGDLTEVKGTIAGACASSTRGIFGGGETVSSPSRTNVIEYITIATLGNAVDFSDLTVARFAIAALSNSTRGLICGGNNSSSVDVNTIDYITIATTGNAVSFGTLTQARRGAAGTSSSTRGIIGGGATPTVVNTVDYITILTTGDAIDFGDLTSARLGMGACSNGHGGL